MSRVRVRLPAAAPLLRFVFPSFSTAVNAVAWCFSGNHVVSVDQGRKIVLWH